MYSNETIKKALANAKRLYNDFIAMDPETIENYHVTISNGNRKIGRVMNVSTMPGLACGNCKACIKFCYDIKACLQYPKNVLFARVKNYFLCVFNRDRFFAEIDNAISRRRTNKYFRWHVAGDILDYNYFCRMVEIARKHSDFVFWTYTKMYHIVNLYVANNGRTAIPGNFHIMFSKWDGMPMENPYNFPVFYCILKDGNKDNSKEFLESLYRCPGNCDVCKECRRGCLAGESTAADEH